MTAAPMAGPKRLRDDPESLAGLVQATANHLGIDRAFVEKDFWVTELLRVVAGGDSIPASGAAAQPVTAIFKGGTSLSRAFRIIERFSEDVDILLVFPDTAGAGARDKALKRIGERARLHLGLDPNGCVRQESTTGVKRNLQYYYPRVYESPHTREYLLLEMGSRGGPNPHETHSLRSMVAEFAEIQFGESPDDYAEFGSFEVEVLAAERTLMEKLVMLHDLASRVPGQNAEEALAKAGRHYYDIHCLLKTPAVRMRLAELGPDGRAGIVNDIMNQSAAAGWTSTAPPQQGLAESPAFDPVGPAGSIARHSYEVAMDMVYGDEVSFDACIETVGSSRDLL